jgi:hypothetical protein
LADSVRRSKIKGFEIHWAPTGGDLSPDFSLRGLTVTARTPDGQEDVLVDEPSGRNFAHFDFAAGQTPENAVVLPDGSTDVTFAMANQVAHVTRDGKAASSH